MGEGEEGGLAGGAELGDPNLAWGPALPMKLQVWWSGICLLSHCSSFYKLCCSLRPPKLVPLRLAVVLARGGISTSLSLELDELILLETVSNKSRLGLHWVVGDRPGVVQ